MTVPIGGHVAPEFEHVRDVFAANFTDRGELGASLALVVDGETVVDLWGGHTTTDRDQVWREDTVALVYSLTKGMSGLAAAVAHSQGRFGYGDLITDIWPEFNTHGKGTASIRQVLSEQAGMASIATKLDPSSMADPTALAAVLAAEKPDWPVGEWAGNHAYTIGWLAGELIRRTDPSGRTLGPYFADEIASRLDVDFFIGLPADFPRERIARIDGWSPLRLPFHMGRGQLPWRMVLGMFMPWSVTFRTLNNPNLALTGPSALDTEAYWAVENGGAGGISNARSIARIYGEFARGGQALGIDRATLDELEAPAPRPARGWSDQVLKLDLEYSLGLEKPFAKDNFGSDDRAYGTFALGGSFAFADPAKKVGYAYTTNKLGFYRWADPREKSCRDAIYDVLGA